MAHTHTHGFIVQGELLEDVLKALVLLLPVLIRLCTNSTGPATTPASKIFDMPEVMRMSEKTIDIFMARCRCKDQRDPQSVTDLPAGWDLLPVETRTLSQEAKLLNQLSACSHAHFEHLRRRNDGHKVWAYVHLAMFVHYYAVQYKGLPLPDNGKPRLPDNGKPAYHYNVNGSVRIGRHTYMLGKCREAEHVWTAEDASGCVCLCGCPCSCVCSAHTLTHTIQYTHALSGSLCGAHSG